MKIQSSMGLAEWSQLLLLSVLWGGSFTLVELCIAVLPPLTVVTVRVALAAAALWVFLGLRGDRIPADPRIWIQFLVIGILNNVIPFSLIIWGQTYIASGLAAILNATTPLFTVLVAAVALPDERPTLAKGVGVAIGLLGTVVMIGPAALADLGINAWAQLAVVVAAFSYALAGVFGRRFRDHGVAPVMVSAGQLSGATLILIPLTAVVDRPWQLQMPNTEVIAALVVLALLCTAFAYILYFRVLAAAGATNLMLVTFLIPVSAVVLGIFALGERLLANQVAGMVLIALGLLAIDGRLLARWRTTKP